MSKETIRKQYERANRWRALAFVERPLIGSPGAPAQAESNVSNIWAHLNGGFLFAYEYSRWWKECWALRNTAVLGDWSWLNKVRVTGPDAARLMNCATVKDLGRQRVGQIVFTPMVNADGKVAIEGLTFRLGENEYLFTQSGALHWLSRLKELTGMDVALEDVTPDYTCFALQGPRALEILEAVSGEGFRDLAFSRWRRLEIAGLEVIVGRQGVTGEVGYEFLARTESGRAHELWRTVREAGRELGLRELGFKAQMVGHTETGIATVIRDFLPARVPVNELAKLARRFISEEELAAIDWDLSEQFCSPAELGWGHTVDLDAGDFLGRDALAREADAGGPARAFVGLAWNGDDMAELFAAQFRDEPSAPPFDLPYGQFRLQFLKLFKDRERVGWATGPAYSPNLKRMISMARIDKALALPGAEVEVLWGGFSDEPSVRIRATVAQLPFIARRRELDLGGASGVQ